MEASDQLRPVCMLIDGPPVLNGWKLVCVVSRAGLDVAACAGSRNKYSHQYYRLR
jgi:hypothetical protein